MRKRYHTEFGATVGSILTARGMTQAQLAEDTGRSTSYVNDTVTGRKTASASWCDLVASATALSQPQRAALHVAAARDKGYTHIPPMMLDLTRK